MSGNRKYPVVLLTGVLSVVMLSACGNVKEKLGLNKSAPDEFAVVSRAPLSVPPDSTLRPPREGSASAPDRVSTPEKARQNVFGIDGRNTQTRSYGGSMGEQALLRRAGADRANSSIRAQVDEETAAIVEADDTIVKSLMFWKEDKVPAEVVNANEENKRLQRRQALGLPSDDAEVEGENPPEPEEEGFFESLF